jgi:Ribonuclease G/E
MGVDGIIKSKETVASESLQKLSQFLKSVRKEHVELTGSPEVIEVLSRDNCRHIRQLEEQSNNRISLVGDAHVHAEDVRIKRILDRRKRLW